jgi:Xaa-Pro dipeptidase
VTGGKQQTNLKSTPVEAVVDALVQKGLASARIGFEMRNIKNIHYEQLRSQLPQATFVDADPILWRLRILKTEEEINRLRVACRAIDKAAEVGFRSARAGMTELEMERIVIGALVEEGCSLVVFLIGFGPKGAQLVAPTENQLEEGQIMRFDISAEYRGYIGDISRVAAFGKVNDRAEWAHRVVLSANEAMRQIAAPGVSGAEIRRLEMDIFQREGLTPLIPMAGHGVGRTVHEHPFMTGDDATVLTPGMTIALEPTIRLQGVGSVNIEDTVVITNGGLESLTMSPRGLYDYT